MPKLTGPLVVALLYDGLCTFEFGIVAEIFGLARPEMGPEWYRFASCALDEGPMRAHGGFLIMADSSPDLLRQADIIVVPGWKGADVPVSDALCQELCAAHERGARLASICSGAFVVAATGLLSGGTATTHWRYADRLRTHFPDVEVDDASLYREHNRIYTSAGSAAGIDLMIEIVRQDFGALAANSVARRLVMPAHRMGGQAQFLERPVAYRKGLEIRPASGGYPRESDIELERRTDGSGMSYECPHIPEKVFRCHRAISWRLACGRACQRSAAIVVPRARKYGECGASSGFWKRVHAPPSFSKASWH